MAVIGGRAHLNGITFVTDTHMVRGKLLHGTVSIKVRRLPAMRLFNVMDKVPFLRGVSKLAKLNLKLFIGSILILAIPWDWILPYDNWFVPESVGLEFAFYGFVMMILVIRLKRLWQFHGAEHKAFNLYMGGGHLSQSAVREANRVSQYCGTNLAVIVLPIVILLSYATLPLIVLAVSLPIGYEIINWSSGSKRLKPALLVGSFIQKYIVTAEPTEEQIQLATATLLSAIKCVEESNS